MFQSRPDCKSSIKQLKSQLKVDSMKESLIQYVHIGKRDHVIQETHWGPDIIIKFKDRAKDLYI